MSEEILRALMELFALVVKQDGGMLENERAFVMSFLAKQVTHDDADQYRELFDSLAGPVVSSKIDAEGSSPSVKDSVKILNICKKINRTLNREQKVVVLIRLYELINSDKRFTTQRMNIINTVAEVFRIPVSEFKAIEQFIRSDEKGDLNNPAIFTVEPGDTDCSHCDGITTGFKDTLLVFLHSPSSGLFFLKYISDDQLYLNGLPVSSHTVYTFPSGSSLRSSQGSPIYYTDVASRFFHSSDSGRFTLVADNIRYRFDDGKMAISDVSFSAESGNLIGILGASGSGKTTLINLLSGITEPSEGSVRISGKDISDGEVAGEGAIGFVPQNDMLMENLSVFENIYYAARLSFRDKSRDEIRVLVKEVLSSLDLYELKDLKVGSPMNKVISGGQRKRLNIALELLREPSILFLDEPTSGLSSSDSENVMDLLRELSIRGKLVITVVHQPSSDIYKLFNRVVILDQGGHMTYFGNPVEAIIHFKKLDARIDSGRGECPSCGNVNPETIFRIMESEVVDEFGRYTGRRKVAPHEWSAAFRESMNQQTISERSEQPAAVHKKPGRLHQYLIYLSRDISNKLANRQYMTLTLLEAPLLGFVLSYIIRYTADYPESDVYQFYLNENIPTFIFMSIIVALFLGLVVSAEEIFQDRILLKRERFLNLSRNSYLLSKVSVMTLISAIQVALFLAVATPLLGIKGMFWNYFLVLFATALCANMIGLNISASLNSAVAIYIVIPLVMIPMMVLGGAMFPYDKLNRTITNIEKVPALAELMPTRWSYEALMVTQFRDSPYGRVFYDLERELSVAKFNQEYRLPAISDALTALRQTAGQEREIDRERLLFLSNELTRLSDATGIVQFEKIGRLTPDLFDNEVAGELRKYITDATREAGRAVAKKDNNRDAFITKNSELEREYKLNFHNEKLQDIVTRFYETPKSYNYRNRLIQNYDPIYMDPEPSGLLKFRSHFFSPEKIFAGRQVNTLYFNTMVLLTASLLLYFTLLMGTISVVIKYLGRITARKML